ncbi:MAG: hypothetical protein LBD52_06870 [Prevotellaceae bacterium]|nr:hypothetical protein [Prevotellaceae bacterium]
MRLNKIQFALRRKLCYNVYNRLHGALLPANKINGADNYPDIRLEGRTQYGRTGVFAPSAWTHEHNYGL